MHLKLSKCHFAAAELPFLGHIVGRFGLKIDPTKVEKLKKTKFPTTKREVRQFLGLAGYFRDFIKDYAEIAAPLTNLTKDTTTEPLELSISEKEAATTLINKISEYPVLQFPDFNLPFILETDASNIKIAAVLLQQKQDQLALISCASRLLTSAESKAYLTTSCERH